jgi:hypothetical protein
MQTITITPQIENGRFFIDLPEKVLNSDFIIEIVFKKEGIQTENQKVESPQARMKKIRSFAGIAKSSDFNTANDQWYQQ